MKVTFEAYQGRNGAIYLLRGNQPVLLTMEYCDKLIGSNIFEIRDFDIDDYNKYYSSELKVKQSN